MMSTVPSAMTHVFATIGLSCVHSAFADAVNARKIGADMILLGRAGIVHPDWPTVSSKMNFKPYYPKWDPAIFQKVGVSTVFHNYLMKFPGLVMGGAEKR